MSRKYFIRVPHWVRELDGLEPGLECARRVAEMWAEEVRATGHEPAESPEVRIFRRELWLTGLAPDTRFEPPIDCYIAIGKVD